MGSIKSLIFETIGYNKEELKMLFYSNGFSPIWDIFRDHIFGFSLLISIAFCLLLEAFKPVHPKNRLINGNLIQDYLFPVFEAILLTNLIAHLLAGLKIFYDTYVPFLNTGLLDNQPFIIQVIGAFLIADFMVFFSHYIHHKVPWLWHFHTIHHSQKNLNAFTAHRLHPFSAFSKFLIMSIPIGFIGGTYPAWYAFGVINGFWAYFIHSNIKTNLGVFRYVFVSPQYHRMHHSMVPEHHDSNFGERLVIWDMLFGTMCPDSESYPETGVKDCELIEEDYNSKNPLNYFLMWGKMLVYPFIKIYQSIKRYFA